MLLSLQHRRRMIWNEGMSHTMCVFNVVEARQCLGDLPLGASQRLNTWTKQDAACSHQQHSHLFTHESDSCTQCVTPAEFFQLVIKQRRLWLQMMSLLRDDSTRICKVLASFFTQREEVGMCHLSVSAYQLILTADVFPECTAAPCSC